jgi:hypothetical protein
MYLQPVIQALATKICTRRGFRTPYYLTVEDTLPKDSKERDRIILIKAGNPPTICVSKEYIELCVKLAEQSKSDLLPSLRDTIERALEYIPRMQNTLSVVPLAEAIAMRRDSKKWAKALVPELHTTLEDEYFDIQFSVTITDMITGSTVTKSVKKLSEMDKMIDKIKFDLSRMVIASRELEEAIENKRRGNIVRLQQAKAAEIGVSIDGDKLDTKMEY